MSAPWPKNRKLSEHSPYCERKDTLEHSTDAFSEQELEALRDGMRLGETEEERRCREQDEAEGFNRVYHRHERRKWGYWEQ